jgi:hypothetical protein
MIRRSIHQDDKVITNLYATKSRDPKFIKKNLLAFKGENRQFNTI